MNERAVPSKTKSNDGRGDFFAVDRRAWAFVTGLGMNPAIAYLVIARGTGGDNRTTKWSTNAIEARTGISRSRSRDAILALEKAHALRRTPESPLNRPKYKITPAHEIKDCKGATDQPDWIWLPNAIIDGAAEEVPPVELVRQTGSVLTLRLLVNLYGSHSLAEDGGIHFRRIRQLYERHRVGEQGAFMSYAGIWVMGWIERAAYRGGWKPAEPPEGADTPWTTIAGSPRWCSRDQS